MLKTLHSQNKLQLGIGFFLGIVFGFLLQKGGVTDYNIIIRQLLFTDFTVLKIMLTAIVTGMVGVYALQSMGLAELHPKPGSLGSTVIGGLIFGIGFGILGYCPGTAVGAVGQGSMDALVGGVIGIIIGAGLFARIYRKVQGNILSKGDFGSPTIPSLLKVNQWVVVIPLATIIIILLFILQKTA